MKSSLALVFAGLMLMSAQASALCTYITESYGGTILRRKRRCLPKGLLRTPPLMAV